MSRGGLLGPPPSLFRVKPHTHIVLFFAERKAVSGNDVMMVRECKATNTISGFDMDAIQVILMHPIPIYKQGMFNKDKIGMRKDCKSSLI